MWGNCGRFVAGGLTAICLMTIALSLFYFGYLFWYISLPVLVFAVGGWWAINN